MANCVLPRYLSRRPIPHLLHFFLHLHLHIDLSKIHLFPAEAAAADEADFDDDIAFKTLEGSTFSFTFTTRGALEFGRDEVGFRFECT